MSKKRATKWKIKTLSDIGDDNESEQIEAWGTFFTYLFIIIAHGSLLLELTHFFIIIFLGNAPGENVLF